jgi:hypothetical protein
MLGMIDAERLAEVLGDIDGDNCRGFGRLSYQELAQQIITGLVGTAAGSMTTEILSPGRAGYDFGIEFARATLSDPPLMPHSNSAIRGISGELARREWLKGFAYGLSQWVEGAVPGSPLIIRPGDIVSSDHTPGVLRPPCRDANGAVAFPGMAGHLYPAVAVCDSCGQPVVCADGTADWAHLSRAGRARIRRRWANAGSSAAALLIV